MNIPCMTLVIPIRRRFQFTTNIIPTATMHAVRKDHEFILVRDECSLGYELERRPELQNTAEVIHDREDRLRVGGWILNHAGFLQEHGVRVLESFGDRQCWTGGLRCSAALNVGVEAASTEWIVGIGDEDLCFLPGWDHDLWRGLEGKDPMKTVSTLTMVMPNVWPSWEAGFIRPHVPTRSWIHASRSMACHQLSFPLHENERDILRTRIGESTWRTYAEQARLPGIHEEACGVRNMCHWVPMLMHRDLLKKAGMWPVDEAAASANDIELDNRLGALGVKKRMPLDAHVLHAKHHLYCSNSMDYVWGERKLLEQLQSARIL